MQVFYLTNMSFVIPLILHPLVGFVLSVTPLFNCPTLYFIIKDECKTVYPPFAIVMPCCVSCPPMGRTNASFDGIFSRPPNTSCQVPAIGIWDSEPISGAEVSSLRYLRRVVYGKVLTSKTHLTEQPRHVLLYREHLGWRNLLSEVFGIW